MSGFLQKCEVGRLKLEGPSIVSGFCPLSNFVWNLPGSRKLLQSGSNISFEILIMLCGVVPECYDEPKVFP